MKTYFQIQNARKMRVYQITAEENGNNKRKQIQLGVISIDSKIPKELFDKLTPDEQQELRDRMKMLKEQAEYEVTREDIRELPEKLTRASRLLATGRLNLTDEQRNSLQTEMNSFLKLLRANKKVD